MVHIMRDLHHRANLLSALYFAEVAHLGQSRPKRSIVHSERDAGMSAGAVQVWFHRLYQELVFSGASSHCERRTFITRIAKKNVEAGGAAKRRVNAKPLFPAAF
jgi:hypothetical protein